MNATATDGTDFYDIDALLTDEERAFRASIRTWVRDRYLPRVSESFDKGVFPVDLIPEMARIGILGMKLHDYGGRGVNNVAYGLACLELERGDSGLRSFASVMNALVMHPIAAFGTVEQRERWLPAMVRGEAIGCFGMTEPHAGSDPAHMRTRAERTADGWVLNGRKMWITNGDLADVAVVWARTEEGIHGFLVERGTPGFATHPIERKFSLRASVTSSLVFENVHIPDSNRLPGAKGLRAAFQCLNEARYGIAWGTIGAAMACYEEALAYARNRMAFDAPVASFQLVQQKLVRMLTEITKGQLLSLRLGRLKDEGKATATQISMAKMNNSREALGIARAARDILGAAGITLAHGVIRHLLNLESVNTYEGTEDVHTLAIGREITGSNAFFCRRE